MSYRHAAAVLACILLSGCARALAPSQLTVTLVPASEEVPAYVRVTGLSTRELRDLRAVSWEVADWQRLLRVAVEATPALAIAGKYVVGADALAFQPAFPFDAGRSYLVRLDLSTLPTPRPGPPVTTSVGLVATDPGPPVEVTAIYPSADVWPENLLRFYIHFSGPMARQGGIEHVRLIADAGEEVRDALLASPVDFWSPDQRRFTVFFDPGRVKSDLVPNQELGRALVAGKRYTIEVDSAWKDALGRPLRETYRHSFEAGPAVDAPMALSEWRLSVPSAGSREPLVLTLPRALDHALLERGVGVARDGAALDGRVAVGAHETTWRFGPAEPWRERTYELIVLGEVEDPQGNRIDQAFEVNPLAEAGRPERPDRYTIPFTPR